MVRLKSSLWGLTRFDSPDTAVSATFLLSKLSRFRIQHNVIRKSFATRGNRNRDVDRTTLFSPSLRSPFRSHSSQHDDDSKITAAVISRRQETVDGTRDGVYALSALRRRPCPYGRAYCCCCEKKPKTNSSRQTRGHDESRVTGLVLSRTKIDGDMRY